MENNMGTAMTDKQNELIVRLRNLKNAKFKDHLRLTDLTSTADYCLKVETLASLTSLNWVTKCCNVIISGSCGVGKKG